MVNETPNSLKNFIELMDAYFQSDNDSDIKKSLENVFSSRNLIKNYVKKHKDVFND